MGRVMMEGKEIVKLTRETLPEEEFLVILLFITLTTHKKLNKIH